MSVAEEWNIDDYMGGFHSPSWKKGEMLTPLHTGLLTYNHIVDLFYFWHSHLISKCCETFPLCWEVTGNVFSFSQMVCFPLK